MNKIIIAGRITKDIELRTTNSGTEVANFTVAVDRRVKKGEEKQTDFIDCTAWGKSGVFVSTYFKKGDGITISGRLESRKYADKDGHNRVAWNVICDDIEFPLGKSNGTNNAAPAAPVAVEVGADEDLPF